MFSSATAHWPTPAATYAALDAEFRFTLDPCPLGGGDRLIMEHDGLARSWAGERVYCNPPYGRGIDRWLAKATEADVAVYLLPARTDTAWWHDYAMQASEIRFLRGRLRFGDAKDGAPFPSVVLVYRKDEVVRHDVLLCAFREAIALIEEAHEPPDGKLSEFVTEWDREVASKLPSWRSLSEPPNKRVSQ